MKVLEALAFQMVLMLVLFSIGHAKSNPAKLASQNETAVSQSENPAVLKRYIPGLEAKVKKNPADKNAQYLLGRAYYFTLQLDPALEHLRVAAETPKPEILDMLSRVYEKRGDSLDLIRVLEQILESHPNEFRVETRLGLAYQQIKKKKEAIEHFKAAIKINPRYRPAYEDLAALFEKEKNWYEERLVYGDMMNNFKPDSKILSAYCRLHAVDGFFEKARELCQLAIEKDPKVAENHVFLALSFKGLENPKQAQQIIFSAAKLYKKSEVTQFYAGQFSDEKKSYEASVGYYSDCIKADPTSSRCMMGIARSAFLSSNYRKSLEGFMMACKVDRTAYAEMTKTTQLIRMKKDDNWYEEFRKNENACKMSLKLEKRSR